MLRKSVSSLIVILILIFSGHAASHFKKFVHESKIPFNSQTKSVPSKSLKTKTGEIIKGSQKKKESNEPKAQSRKNADSKKVSNQSLRDKQKNSNRNLSSKKKTEDNQREKQTSISLTKDNKKKDPLIKLKPSQEATEKYKKTSLETSKIKFSTPMKLIVTTISEPLRSTPNPNAEIIDKIKLGTSLSAFGKSDGWYLVRYSNGLEGWISAYAVAAFDKTEKLMLQISERNYNEQIDFNQALELTEFLTQAINQSTTPEAKAKLELLKLRTIKQALTKISPNDQKQEPYRDFLKKYKEIIVYDEVNSKWIVTSKAFWNLEKKYSGLPIADEIAWEAAQNPLPGKCEGDLVCMLFQIRVTNAEYLRLFPNGTKSTEALEKLISSLEEIISNGNIYPVSKDQFSDLMIELKTIVTRLNLAKKEQAQRQLQAIIQQQKNS
jgi:hypothetical protein